VQSAIAIPVVLWRSARQDWLTLALVTATLVVAAYSIDTANWVETPSLSLAAGLGALAGFVAARYSGRPWRGHLVAMSVGVLAVYLQGMSITEARTLPDSFLELNSRLLAWLTVLRGNDISVDPLPFALLLSVLTFSSGYLAAWAVFKLGNLWLAVLPSALGLLLNLTYLPERYYVYVFPYMLAAMLLIVRVSSLQLVSRLDTDGIRHPASLHILWLLAGVVITSIIVGTASLFPPYNARHPVLRQIWNTSHQPADWFQGEFGRLFAGVGSKEHDQSWRFGNNLPILPTSPTGNEPIFLGYVPYPVYWKVRAYTSYNSGGWTIENTSMIAVPPLPPFADEYYLEPAPGDLSYHVEMKLPTWYLFVPAPNVAWVDVPAEVEGNRDAASMDDMLTLRPKKRLRAGDSYSGYTINPIYDENTLRSAGRDNPSWLSEAYLELPSSVPQRVKDLALRLTQRASNEYDKARAIEDYLRTLKYGASSSTPGFNQDRVDYFLFETKTGHSDHFASAMAVMLRSVGVPARLVSGYGPGVSAKEEAYFTVREGDQHSWTEVYFPALGWVEFEPSPIYPLRPRGLAELMGLAAGLGGDALEGTLPDETMSQNTGSGENGEEDSGGGRLPGGEGLRPIPLLPTASSLSTKGALLIVLTALWAIGLWALWRRLFLRLPHPELAYQRMYGMAGLLGMAQLHGQTPMEYGNILAALIPETRDDISVICESFCKVRYGRTPLSRREQWQLRQAWDRVRKAMVQYSLR